MIDLIDVGVVIPVVKDQSALASLLEDLSHGKFGAILIACGDQSEYELNAYPHVRLVRSPLGRGTQIAYAIDESQCEWVWVVHADTRVSAKCLQTLKNQLKESSWGAFPIQLDDDRVIFRVVETLMNMRSSITSIFTGDQGIFFQRNLMAKVGGFPRIPLFEDIECSRRLKTQTKGSFVSSSLITSTRRWQKHGIVKTILQMWWFRWLYYIGKDPQSLANRYYATNRYE